MTTLARRITGGGRHAPRRPRGGCSRRTRRPTRRGELRHHGAGYRRLPRWLEGFGTIELVGVEGTGSDGAGLTRHLLAHEIAVVEVDRPNRQRRRRTGKSDPEDAVAAARAAQGGEATGLAQARDRNVEAMGVRRVARFSDATNPREEPRGFVALCTRPTSSRSVLTRWVSRWSSRRWSAWRAER
jgi:transposase